MYEQQTLAVHGLPSGDGACNYATDDGSLLTGDAKDGQSDISTGRSNGESHLVYLDSAQFECLASPSLPYDQARACMLPRLKQ